MDIFHVLLKRPEVELDFSNSRVSVLSAVAQCRNEEIFQTVIKIAQESPKGLNLKGALLEAAKNGNTPILQRLLALDETLLDARNDDAQTPLCLAAMWDKIEMTRYLLEQPGIDINPIDKYNCTSITWAINWAGGTPEIVDMLLARRETDPNNQDAHRDTPIGSAARAGRAEITQSLIKRSDVDVNRLNRTMYTPLIWAASRGHPKIVELLLTREDIKTNVRESSGMTAIAWAVYGGNIDIIRLLVEKGADFDVDKPSAQSGGSCCNETTQTSHEISTEVRIKADLISLEPDQRVLYLQQIPSALRRMVDMEALEAFSR